MTYQGAAIETSDEDWDRLIATNLTGAFRIARAAGRHLTAQGSGKLVNVASMVGLRGAAHLAAYCASKAGLINLTRALAVEWAQFGVQANALAPGYVETDMNAELRGDEARMGPRLDRAALISRRRRPGLRRGRLSARRPRAPARAARGRLGRGACRGASRGRCGA